MSVLQVLSAQLVMVLPIGRKMGLADVGAWTPIIRMVRSAASVFWDAPGVIMGLLVLAVIVLIIGLRIMLASVFALTTITSNKPDSAYPAA